MVRCGFVADGSWNVPEPELALVVSPAGQIVGYTIGNDMSSRDIEGENPLYLPQAKVYDGSCAIGPVHPRERNPTAPVHANRARHPAQRQQRFCRLDDACRDEAGPADPGGLPL